MSTITPLAWGPFLQELRDRAGYTQTDLARAIGKSQQLVSAWEKGDAEPNIGLAMEILALLNARPKDYRTLRDLRGVNSRTACYDDYPPDLLELAAA